MDGFVKIGSGLEGQNEIFNKIKYCYMNCHICKFGV